MQPTIPADPDSDLEQGTGAWRLGRPGGADQHLARALDLDRHTLVVALGGGWFEVQVHHDALTPERYRQWFGSGVPLQVLLSVEEDRATVALPVEHEIGLAGPAHLRAEESVTIPLDSARALTRLARTIRQTAATTQATCGVCDGCRRYRHVGVGSTPGDLNEYCIDCHRLYFGLIAD